MDAETQDAGLFALRPTIEVLERCYPRLLSCIDRDPDSPTYGSCDRGFWMYRLHDFDSGVLQQQSLSLAVLCGLADASALSGCKYLNSALRPFWAELARAINRRTLIGLSRGGMLDEYYPGERSYPGTVFAAYALLRSAVMLGQAEVIESRALEATARGLLTRKPGAAANQDAAAAAFLALYAKTRTWLSGEAQEAVARLVSGGEAGGYLEYGGVDIGYSSVTLNYLACMADDRSFDTTGAIRSLAALLSAFVSPAGRFGGEFASRSTTYVLPFGLLQAAYLDPAAGYVFSCLDLAVITDKLDDRYLLHYCLPSFALMALALAKRGPPATAAAPPGAPWQVFRRREAGLVAARRGECAVYVGLNKGGAFQVENGGTPYIDCGYRLKRKGLVYATCVIGPHTVWEQTEADDCLTFRVTSGFYRYGWMVPSATKTVILRLLQLLGPQFNRFFKRVLIQTPQPLPGVTLQREIVLDHGRNRLTVRDRISGQRAGDMLRRSPASSLRLVPSAKFHQAGEEEAFLRVLPIESTELRQEFDLGKGCEGGGAA
jgi:hypothetical protein